MIPRRLDGSISWRRMREGLAVLFVGIILLFFIVLLFLWVSGA
jgi:hypothetical protein